jgi:hypothetical protein
MEILRNIFGTLTSGVVRILVSVAVLAAAYFFIVKPVLKTTSDAIKTSSHSFEKSFGKNGFEEIGKSIRDVNREVQRQVHHSFEVTKKNGGNPQKLVRCVQRAHGDVHRIQRCTVKF